MKRSECLARLLIAAATLGVVAVPLFFWARTPLIRARVPEAGGWNPEVLQARVGEPLHLKLTSDDVMHGFAVGQLDVPAVDVLPGEVTEITLIFKKPGKYTFYCTRWCGPNHWRMRGTIEVSGSQTDPEPAAVPLYVSLGLNLDAPHESPIIPAAKPSARRGQSLAALASLPSSTNYYRSHSPYQAFVDLAGSPLTEGERWDVVAYLWQSQTTPEGLANGARLYAQNCAACHGERGAGDGVFAAKIPPSERGGDGRPASFTDPSRMLAASPALLQGKILRGGMGSGMPMWGSIFTEEQTWDLVAYLYSFQFEYRP